jgi:hypothetical protein
VQALAVSALIDFSSARFLLPQLRETRTRAFR